MTGDQLKQLRRDLGEAIGRPLSVNDFAKLCGLPPESGGGTILEWENGYGPIGPVAALLSLLAVGILGMPRRVVSYDPALQGLNISASLFAFGLGASMLLFLVNLVIDTVVKPRRAAVANPWESLGYEWQMPHPIPVHNFATPPTGWTLPYDYDRVERPRAVPGGGMALPEGVTK